MLTTQVLCSTSQRMTWLSNKDRLWMLSKISRIIICHRVAHVFQRGCFKTTLLRLLTHNRDCKEKVMDGLLPKAVIQTHLLQEHPKWRLLALTNKRRNNHSIEMQEITLMGPVWWQVWLMMSPSYWIAMAYMEWPITIRSSLIRTIIKTIVFFWVKIGQLLKTKREVP